MWGNRVVDPTNNLTKSVWGGEEGMQDNVILGGWQGM